jgi:MFS family permease
MVTVLGTTLPVCLLAFTSNVYVFVIAMSVSGFFSATFPLTFAYISDCVDKKRRAPAYGLALATFGLSFCLGPISGSYIAAQFGNRAVFVCSLALVVVNMFYITTYLPETVKTIDVSVWQSVVCISMISVCSLRSQRLKNWVSRWSIYRTLGIFEKRFVYLGES